MKFTTLLNRIARTIAFIIIMIIASLLAIIITPCIYIWCWVIGEDTEDFCNPGDAWDDESEWQKLKKIWGHNG